MDSQATKQRVLFVDDDPNLLSGIKRSLRAQRGVWEMHYAGSAEEALQVIDKTLVDVVVSDMWMPGMNGAQLLNEIARLQPHTIRFVLSGHSDERSILRLVGSAHRYIAKPCDSKALKLILERAFMLQALLEDNSLLSVIASIDSLPSCPAVFMEMRRKLASPDATLRELGRLIAKDPPISAKLLQMVNSSFFGIGRRISNPEEAATLLGLDTLKSLVLSAGIFRQFEEGSRRSGLATLMSIWRHSVAVGCLARDIAHEEGCDHVQVDDAMSAGLLHDVGMLLFIFKLPEQWKKIEFIMASEGITQWQAEQQVTGVAHSRLGAYLLGLWGLPDALVEAVAYSHSPDMSPIHAFGSLTALHVADVLLQNDQRLNESYLASIGLSHRLPAWRSLAASMVERNKP